MLSGLDKVDAMAMMFYGMLKKEGNELLINADEPVSKGMTKREAVEKGQAKWGPIVAELNRVIHMLSQNCSFCHYFQNCSRCPIGKDRKGTRCVEYWELGSRLPEMRDLAQDVLDKINDTDIVEHCSECGKEL